MKRFGAYALLALLCATIPTAQPINSQAFSAGSSPPSPAPFTAYDAAANDLLSKMTLEEKVGQMTQAEQDALVDPNDIQNYFLGSVLSGGNSDPKEGNSLEAWTNM